MKLLVGLGNPGREYESTRHNVGFRIARRWTRRRGVVLDTRRFDGVLGHARVRGPSGAALEVAVLLPLAWMNRSGPPVAAAVAALGADPAADVLVAFDDVDLPFGKLRLRAGGGPGGHRGVADVIAALGRSDFPRLRFGVGRPEGTTDTAEWVLSPFTAEEEAGLDGRLEAAADAVDAALFEGIGPAMNRFNRERAREAPESLQ